SLCITASGGLANIQQFEEGESLIRRADEALYAAKNGGRNCGYASLGNRSIPIPAAATLSASDIKVPTFKATSDPVLEPLSEQLLAACIELREHVERISAPSRITEPAEAREASAGASTK